MRVHAARVHVKGAAELLAGRTPDVCVCMPAMGTYLRAQSAQTSVSGHGAISGAVAQLILRFIGGSYYTLSVIVSYKQNHTYKHIKISL